MARGDSDLGALTEALSSSEISKEKQPTDPSNGDDAGGVQITCFSEVVHDTTTLHFQIMRLPKQVGSSSFNLFPLLILILCFKFLYSFTLNWTVQVEV